MGDQGFHTRTFFEFHIIWLQPVAAVSTMHKMGEEECKVRRDSRFFSAVWQEKMNNLAGFTLVCFRKTDLSLHAFLD